MKSKICILRVFVKRVFKDNERCIFVLQSILTLLMLILHSISSSQYIDFIPINGTFQNFNPIRRLISAGEVPYKDFVDYLGLGHLFSGSLFTWIFGGDYQASYIAFILLSILSFSLLVFMLGNSILNNKNVALLVVNISLLIIFIQPLFYTNAIGGTKEIINALDYACGPGNSARYIRGMIMPIFVIMYLCGIYYLQKSKNKVVTVEKHYEKLVVLLIGVLAGISFVWSNDYGISCWLCSIIMVFFVTFFRKRKCITTILASVCCIIISIVTIYIFIQLVTKGNFTQWFAFTFGTGGYQAWYYNGDKAFYIYDVDFSFYMMVQATLCLFYLWKLYINKGDEPAIKRYGIPAFANMTCFCAVNEYRLLSGGVMREVALATLFMTFLFEVVRFLRCILTRHSEYIYKIFVTGVCVVSLGWISSGVKEQVEFYIFQQNKWGDYFEELGGRITLLGDDLEAAENFLGDKKVFSTYASALEVITDQYQPSGTDYIIHVLGEQQRENYLEAFQNGEFDYVATITDDSNSNWEYWIQRANWFWYRELFKEWKPVYANSYELFWEKNSESIDNVIVGDIEIEVTGDYDSEKIIEIKTDKEINGIADVYIDYEVVKEKGLRSKLVFQTMLQVKNTGNVYSEDIEKESNYLRNKSAEYIPITIVDGYGKAIITSCPESNTWLKLNEIKCDVIYPVTHQYVKIEDISETDEELILCVKKSEKNIDILENAKKIEVDDIEFIIEEIEIVEDRLINEDDEIEIEDGMIYLTVDLFEYEAKKVKEIIKKQNMIYVSNEDE